MINLKRYFVILLLATFAIIAKAQLSGVVIDSENGDTIAFASVLYKGKGIASISDVHGRFRIAKHDGWTLTVSAIGYKSKQIKVAANMKSPMDIKLQPDSKYLDEVTIKSKRSRYSRKENPAVDLMRKVVAAKHNTKLENKDYYQYRNYEKLTIALNNMSTEKLDSGKYAKKPWLKNQLETNPLTDSLILPVMVTEKVSHMYYRKDPKKERIYIDAEKSHGVNDLIETGDVFTTAFQDIFTEVDIYDDQVRLLQYPFTSPISNDALGFYRFYIVDTVKIERDSCIQVSFMPNNQQDFGFRGDLWIIKDSTWHVKKVHLSIPRRSDVNFVKNMTIDQEYMQLPSGDWVLSTNDMNVNLVVLFNDFFVSRVSRRNDYGFEAIEDKIFRGKALEKRDPYSEMRDDDYWTDNREVGLSKGEIGMNEFLNGIKKSKGFGWIMFAYKAIMENFIETGTKNRPSKVDIGPVTSMFSSNDIDGFRLRLSAMTTAHLHKHIFLKGYIARGFDSKKMYYNATAIYSFNKKAYTSEEFPKKNITISSTYDLFSPSDKFMDVDKDNIFAAIRWTSVRDQAFINRQNIDFTLEQDWGFTTKVGITFEENTAAGGLKYENLMGENIGRFRTTEAYLQFIYRPGQTYINLKTGRRLLNRDAPVFKIKHSIGIQGIAGSNYNYNVTEAGIYKRFWVKSWGKMDFYLKGGYQWNEVPFPLLIAPAANVSWIYMRETFGLLKNMEFLNDKYVSLQMEWDMNGKVLNRIPLLKKLHARELVGVNVLYAGLSDHNNPFKNTTSKILMPFPERVHIMNDVPYVEVRVGIHNLFNLLSVEYIRRLTYTNISNATCDGVRFGFRLTF